MGKKINLSKKTVTEDKNGNVSITSKVTVSVRPTDNNDLTTKLYVDNAIAQASIGGEVEIEESIAKRLNNIEKKLEIQSTIIKDVEGKLINVENKRITINEIRGNSYIENGIIKTVENKDGLKLIVNPNDTTNLFRFSNEQIYKKEICKNRVSGDPYYITSPNSCILSSTPGRTIKLYSDNLIPIEYGERYMTCYKSTSNDTTLSFVICYDEQLNLLLDVNDIGTYVESYNGYIQRKDTAYSYPDRVKYIQLGFRTLPIAEDYEVNSSLIEASDNIYFDVFDIGFYKANNVNDVKNVINSKYINLHYYSNNDNILKIKELNYLNDEYADRLYNKNNNLIYEKNCIKTIINGDERIIESKDFSLHENVLSFYILINDRIQQSNEIGDNGIILCNRFNYNKDIMNLNIEGIDYINKDNVSFNSLNSCDLYRGFVVHINKTDLIEQSIEGFRAKLKEWYNEGNPLTIISQGIKETYNVCDLSFDELPSNINISVNSIVKPQINIETFESNLLNQVDTNISKLENITHNLANQYNYIDLQNMCLLSEELLKTNKSINEIIQEKKRVIIDGSYELNERIILTGSGYKLVGINDNSGFIQTTPGECVIQLGDEGIACTGSIIDNISLSGKTKREDKKTGSGILIDFAYGCTIKNVNITNCGGYGIEGLNNSSANGCWIFKFIDCRISYNVMGGVYLKHVNDTQNNDIVFDRCTIQGNGGYYDENGTLQLGSSKITVENALVDYGHGIDISGAGIKILNGDVEGNGGIGIKINEGYCSGITITGNYLEPNRLTNIYLCKSGVKDNLYINGNFFMEAGTDKYKLGKYYIEDGLAEIKYFNTQLYDKTHVLNISKNASNLPIMQNSIYENLNCLYDISDMKGPLNFKVTMGYKSIIEHGNMTFSLVLGDLKSRIIDPRCNKNTLLSNVCSINSVANNEITLNEALNILDDSWTHLIIHIHDYEYEYEGGFTNNNDIVIEKSNVIITDNTITLNNLSSNNLNKIPKTTHVCAHKLETVGNTASLYQYSRIPVSTEYDNEVVDFNSLMNMKKFSEGRRYFKTIRMWGTPYSYNHTNHIMNYLKIERTDMAYVYDNSELDELIKHNYMRIFIASNCTYVTYKNNKYYKEDGTEYTF